MIRRVNMRGLLGLWLAPWALTLACGGKQLNDVGDVGVSGAGRGSSAGSGGSSDAGDAQLPEPPHGGTTQRGGGDSGGTAGGAQYGAGANAGASSYPDYNCFGYSLMPDGYGSPPIERGPRNTVFGELQTESEPKNYADQAVFSGTAWRLNANYEAVPLAVASDETLDLPEVLPDYPASVGELRLTVSACEGFSVAGRTVRVEVWWKVGGAGTAFPTHGMALGAGENPTWFEDSTKQFTVGQPEQQRVMNTLSSLVLEHTFADDDETSAADVFLTAWVLADFEFTSTFYLSKVEWQPVTVGNNR